MEKLSRAVELESGLSIRGIRGLRLGKTEYVDRARECLVEEGYIDPRQEGQAIRHYSIRPYREADDDS